MGQPTAGWDVYKVTRGQYHVVPVDDEMEHDCSHRCPCGPTWQLVRNECDEHLCTSWLFTHHSLDGRERHE